MKKMVANGVHITNKDIYKLGAITKEAPLLSCNLRGNDVRYSEPIYRPQNHKGVRVQPQNVLKTWSANENDTKTYPKVMTFLMSSGDKCYAIGTHYVTLDLCTCHSL